MASNRAAALEPAPKQSRITRRLGSLVPGVRRLRRERDEARQTIAQLASAVEARDAALALSAASDSPSESAVLEQTPRPATVEGGWPPALGPEHLHPNARLYADRVTALSHLPRGGRIAEVGVAFGDFSLHLISELHPDAFHAFDLFEFGDANLMMSDRPAGERLQGKSARAFYDANVTDVHPAGLVTVYQGDSRESLAARPDNSYDVIYIDGDHTLDGVRADAAIAARKVREDGFLVFNDYIIYDPISESSFGVVHAVNQLCLEEGWQVHYLALAWGMFCDVCIHRSA